MTTPNMEPPTNKDCCEECRYTFKWSDIQGCHHSCHRSPDAMEGDWAAFDELARKLRLREETVSGVDEYGMLRNFIRSRFLSKAALRETIRNRWLNLKKPRGIDYFDALNDLLSDLGLNEQDV